MGGDQNSGGMRLWISYPWVSNEENDFTYLVPQLKAADIHATYDSFQLPADAQQLGRKIVQRLVSIGFDGWLYILTHQCFTRRAYTEVLTQAIDQTRAQLGPSFPLAGLMHGISPLQVPPVLRVLPCVSLGASDWRTQLSRIMRSDLKPGKRRETRFIWKVHNRYDGDPSTTAIEVRSRGERIQYWRFAVPKSAKVVRWGQGRAGGNEISRITFAEARGTGRYENNDVAWFGAANAISSTESAFAVFSGPLPDFICFGPSPTPFGSPGQMEMFWPGLMKEE